MGAQPYQMAGGGLPSVLPEESTEILEISASLPLAQPTQQAAPHAPSVPGGAPPAVFANSNPFAMGAQEEADSKLPQQSPGPVAEGAAPGSSSMMGGTGDSAVFGWPSVSDGAGPSSIGSRSNRHKLGSGRQPSDASEEAVTSLAAQGSQGSEAAPYASKVTGKSQWRNEFQ